MRLAIPMLSIVLVLAGTAAPEAEEPEPLTVIIREAMDGGVRFAIEKRDITREYPGNPNEFHFEYALRLDDFEPVYLARAFTDSSGRSRLGLDESTVTLTTLQSGRMLAIEWQTLPQGSGINTIESDLVLLRTAAGWKDIYRNSRPSASRSGAESRSTSQTTFAFDPSLGILHVTWIAESAWHGNERKLLMKPHESGVFIGRLK